MSHVFCSIYGGLQEAPRGPQVRWSHVTSPIGPESLTEAFGTSGICCYAEGLYSPLSR